MADISALITRVRTEVGDFPSPFFVQFIGSDELSSYDLPETGVSVATVSVTTGAGSPVTLVAGTDYVLDVNEGRLVLMNPTYSPLHHGQVMTVTGSGGGMFSDVELTQYLTDALSQHGYGRVLRQRYQDQHGFIRYLETPISLANLPPVEDPLLGYLATINVLWTLATDAATDIDISTAEGTSVPRTQRYRQLMEHIEALQARYNALAAQLNVGLGRIEMFTLRRVSRTTNRLIPIFRDREYDDAALPQRELPVVDGVEYEDTSGIPSPLLPGVWG